MRVVQLWAMTTDQYLGERVHVLLWRRGMTTTELAALMHISPATMSRKLHGTVRWSVDDLMAEAWRRSLPDGRRRPTWRVPVTQGDDRLAQSGSGW